MLASDLNNPEFSGAVNPDSRLYVTFYKKPQENAFLSNINGRPIFEDVVFCRIIAPGDSLAIPDAPATEEQKQRFPLQWQHFLNTGGNEETTSGTPLSSWPQLTRSQVEELRAMKFFTVEQVANASDQQISKIGMLAGMQAFAFREAALRYLRVASDASALAKAEEETKESRDLLAAQHAKIEEMALKMEALERLLDERVEKRGPGRPPKQQEAA